jgi:hypothetical protein
VSRIGEETTAFSNRDPAYLLHPLAAWMKPADDDRHIAWLRELVRDMEPFTTGGVASHPWCEFQGGRGS